MSDNFVTCRHCGVGINYRCDHEERAVVLQEKRRPSPAPEGGDDGR